MPKEILQNARRLAKAGQWTECLQLLQRGLRRKQLGSADYEKVGASIRKAIETGAVQPTLRVRILGQCTTHWLVSAVAAVAWSQDVLIAVEEGGYDTVLQDLTSAPQDAAADIVIFLPWNQRLLGANDLDAESRVQGELAYWAQAASLLRQTSNARLIQVGYDWTLAGPQVCQQGAAPGGAVDLVRQVNRQLREQLPPGGLFLDLEQISGTIGRQSFYDSRSYFWTKQPFSEAGLSQLGEHLWAGIRSQTTGPKKVLVLDLDNTLWGGVVGETGPLGIGLGESPDGEAFRAFQQYVKELSRLGVVLAVASKNNPNDAREPFEQNPAMVLRLTDIAAFEACWEPKFLSIRRIAATLSLGLDSFVFFDDNPVEREHILQELPEVVVVDVPPDPADYVSALHAGLWFERAALTADDQQRSAQYFVERQRRELQAAFTSMDDYLHSLEMQAEVRSIDEADLQRVVQLLGKTNQFNLTTRRHGHDELIQILARPQSIGLSLRVRDKFGDYGLVGVAIATPSPDAAPGVGVIDTFLMSCRVIGRTVEHFLMGELIARAAATGYELLQGIYIPTKKNELVKNFFDDMGFRPLTEGASGERTYELRVHGDVRPKTFVTPLP